MSWVIHLVKNTVKISAEIIAEIQSHPDYQDYFFEDLTPGEPLSFTSENMEGMDIFQNEGSYIIDILKKHKVNGEICWIDLESSNPPLMWGYDFVNGKCYKLGGKLNYFWLFKGERLINL